MSLKAYVAAFGGLLALVAVGCNKPPEAIKPQAKVSGTVTLDGKPMAGGEVRFNVQGQPPVSLPVASGAFSGEVFAGENRVEVAWEKEGRPHPMDPTKKLMENAVSSKFSGPNSTLKATVPEAGASDLSFKATSK